MTDDIKADIYDIMRRHFPNRPVLSYDIAEDFTELEIDKFISVYWDYVVK